MALPVDIVEDVARRLAEHAGLELPAWVVEARTTARIAALEVSPEGYQALLRSPRGESELDELVEAVRVGESRLFRHRSQIAALVNDVLPALRTRVATRRRVRVWSAGCSSGEEAYTLAALLTHALPGFAISILATDVSSDALAAAARASYAGRALDDVPEEWTTGFAIEDGRVCPRPELRALVKLERDNLVDPPRPGEAGMFDLVWCRNVLIYFTAAARARVLARLVAATAPGGTLFVGYSESLRGVPGLEAVRASDAVYYTRRDPAPVAPPRPAPVRASVTADLSGSRTPPPVIIPRSPPPSDVLALRGHPNARAITAELMARLGVDGLRTLTVDLDTAELLGDDLAPVLRRARAAAGAAGVALVLRATRTGARRWLARHGLDEETTP